MDKVAERKEEGHLDGHFVEIQGVAVTAGAGIEAYDLRLRSLGELVDPNGRTGWAAWDPEPATYIVATIDGLVLQVPEDNLVACEREKPEETGGRDLIWPSISLTRGTGDTFAHRVAEVLQEKGYCLIEMPPAEKMRTALAKVAKERDDFELARPSFEETFFRKSG
jgi:hypothetical protein